MSNRLRSLALGLIGATTFAGSAFAADLDITCRCVIGGVNSGVYTPRNVISGNQRAGVELRAGNGHKVLGNFIGMVAFPLFGTTLPNGGAGVLVTGGIWFDIGSMADDGGKNLIGGNDGPGVLISGPADNADAPQGMFVGANNFLLNGGLAVDLSLSATGDDVTANDARDRELMSEWGVAGPPTLMLVGPDGRERRDLRTVGEIGPAQFLERLDQAGVDHQFDGVNPGSGAAWRTWQEALHDLAPRLFRDVGDRRGRCAALFGPAGSALPALGGRGRGRRRCRARPRAARGRPPSPHRPRP